MDSLETWELASYVVTVIALPMAIVIFILERRKERQNDEEELYQRLSDEYTGFLKLVLENADLQLLRKQEAESSLTAEQDERKYVIFGILISIFERAYLLVYEESMSKHSRRLWQSWEDYMHEWCARRDFRSALPQLLEGEDEEFRAYIAAIAEAKR